MSSSAPYQESLARVTWAAHILWYLAGERSHATLNLQSDAVETNLEDDEFDAETNEGVFLTASQDSLRATFLDCVADLSSPSKGWDHVVATGLREYEDFVEVDVARNDGFGLITESSNLKEGADAYKVYCGQLEKYLASASDHSDFNVSTPFLTWFEAIAVEFDHERIDYWIKVAEECVSSIHSIQQNDNGPISTPMLENSTWTTLIRLLKRNCSEEATAREYIVQSAYACINSVDVAEVLHSTISPQLSSRLFKALRFIARPLSTCRLIIRIVTLLPNFGRMRICTVSPPPRWPLSPQYRVDIATAWKLLSDSSSKKELKKLEQFGDKFKKDCARSLGSHSEMQLFLHYYNNSVLMPTINYFGCSKKSCLLCESFLNLLDTPISTRGRHGICYPSWGMPSPVPRETAAVLHKLENFLIARIKLYMNGERRELLLNQVSQSTVVQDLSNLSLKEISRKKEILKTVEGSRELLQEERHILEGGESYAKPSASATGIFVDSYDSCVMCNSPQAQLCAQCKNCWYCSKKCQQSDWASHKLLCKALSNQPPRPSPAHKRAIFFPETSNQPRVTWILCTRKVSSEWEEEGLLVEYETANVLPLLGPNYLSRMHIQRNVIRDRNLGTGIASWSSKKEGYSIELIIRDAFLKDGSLINRSILESVKSGTVHHKWCGPIIAMREGVDEFYQDITLGDFRHLIDYFVTYNNTEVREITNPLNYIPKPRTIKGVKICCYGEIKLHESEPYVQVEVPEWHPIRTNFFSKDSISSISKLLGTTLRLWKFPGIENWIDPPGWDMNLGAESNPDAAFLMMGSKPKRKGWGWAPLYWNNDIGNVLAVREDGGDLLVEEMKLMCYFVRRKLQPMFEDSMGVGLISRTKQEVLNFITRENMEKCRADMENDPAPAF